jgi:flagellar biosynthetic protein FliR
MVYLGLVVARVGTAVAVMPLFGDRTTPRMIKAGVALALSLFWFSSLDTLPEPSVLEALGGASWATYALVVGREALLGAVLGFAFGLFLVPARVAGEFVTQQMGLALSNILGPASDRAAGPLTLILESLSGLLFLGLDLHHVFLATLHATFARYPLGGTAGSVPVAHLVAGAASAEEWGLLLGAPLGLALFLTVVALALLTRAAPQLNIYSVGFTLQAAVGVLAVFVLLPDMLTLLTAIFGRLSDFVVRLV